MDQPLLSVVVPTRNRGQTIGECLTHMTALVYRPLEIVVLDQSTDDLTRAAFERFAPEAESLGILARYAHSTRTGLDCARNDGLGRTTGRWVTFADDDILVQQGWAMAIVREFASDAQIGMVFGQTRPFYPLEKGKRTRISVKDSPRREMYKTRWAAIKSVGAGNSMAISRSAFERVGPFDERLDVGTDLPGGGDFEMIYRVLRYGFRIVYSPDAVAYHKRWLPEEKYLDVEHGYYIGHAAALVKHLRRWDRVATTLLALEGGRRLAEIAYYALVKHQDENVARALVRAKGFVKGVGLGWRTFGEALLESGHCAGIEGVAG